MYPGLGCRPSILAPSKRLLDEYKSGRISWEQYSEQFRLDLLGNKKAYHYLYLLKDMAMTKDVYLYCYEKDATHCHRSILLDILRRAGAEVEESK